VPTDPWSRAYAPARAAVRVAMAGSAQLTETRCLPSVPWVPHPGQSTDSNPFPPEKQYNVLILGNCPAGSGIAQKDQPKDNRRKFGGLERSISPKTIGSIPKRLFKRSVGIFEGGGLLGRCPTDGPLRLWLSSMALSAGQFQRPDSPSME
jgi:hypothetical protein